MIYILTGEIRTGKTTALLDWTKGRTDVDGILCPDDKNGKRYFLDVKSREEFELEVVPIAIGIESENTITIGPFHFLKSAFEKANTFLIALGSQKKSQYLIIDELGKLELKNEGLHLAADILIPQFQTDKNHHLILIVRDYLVDAIVKHYNISKYLILDKENLVELR